LCAFARLLSMLWGWLVTFVPAPPLLASPPVPARPLERSASRLTGHFRMAPLAAHAPSSIIQRNAAKKAAPAKKGVPQVRRNKRGPSPKTQARKQRNAKPVAAAVSPAPVRAVPRPTSATVTAGASSERPEGRTHAPAVAMLGAAAVMALLRRLRAADVASRKKILAETAKDPKVAVCQRLGQMSPKNCDKILLDVFQQEDDMLKDGSGVRRIMDLLLSKPPNVAAVLLGKSTVKALTEMATQIKVVSPPKKKNELIRAILEQYRELAEHHDMFSTATSAAASSDQQTAVQNRARQRQEPALVAAETSAPASAAATNATAAAAAAAAVAQRQQEQQQELERQRQQQRQEELERQRQQQQQEELERQRQQQQQEELERQRQQEQQEELERQHQQQQQEQERQQELAKELERKRKRQQEQREELEQLRRQQKKDQEELERLREKQRQQDEQQRQQEAASVGAAVGATVAAARENPSAAFGGVTPTNGVVDPQPKEATPTSIVEEALPAHSEAVDVEVAASSSSEDDVRNGAEAPPTEVEVVGSSEEQQQQQPIEAVNGASQADPDHVHTTTEVRASQDPEEYADEMAGRKKAGRRAKLVGKVIEGFADAFGQEQVRYLEHVKRVLEECSQEGGTPVADAYLQATATPMPNKDLSSIAPQLLGPDNELPQHSGWHSEEFSQHMTMIGEVGPARHGWCEWWDHEAGCGEIMDCVDHKTVLVLANSLQTAANVSPHLKYLRKGEMIDYRRVSLEGEDEKYRAVLVRGIYGWPLTCEVLPALAP